VEARSVERAPLAAIVRIRRVYSMTMISKAAFAALLLAGTSALVATPASAKDKQDKKEQPQIKLSDEFRKAAAPAQTALAAGDLATAETNVTAAETAAKTDDEKYIAAELRLQLLAKQNAGATSDPAAVARADASYKAPLDALLNNPKTPTDQRGKLANARGQIAFNEKNYPDAIKYYAMAQQAGYSDPDMTLALARAKVQSGDVPGGIAALDQVVKGDEAKGQKAPEDFYKYAVANLYKTNDRATTLDWVKRWLTAYPSAENWRSAIIVFGFQGPTAARLGKPEKLDLYRLMNLTGALADRGDFIEYAQFANDLGLPDEAKTVIAKGKASGKIPASDADAAAIDRTAAKGIASEGSLSSLATKAASSAKGDLAQQTADAYLGQGNYAKAIELYKLALQKGVTNSDQANMHLGIAEAMSGDKASAATQFAAVQNEPGKDIAGLWRAYVSGGAATTTAPPAATPPQG
jgi:PBP1b-binding outer membrane lipoprotein LpoB